MRALIAVAMAMMVMCGLAGCSDDSYNRDDAIQQLQDDAGMTKEQATCVVDAVEDEFGVAKLQSNDDLTDEETTKLGEITLNCMGNDLGDLLDTVTTAAG